MDLFGCVMFIRRMGRRRKGREPIRNALPPRAVGAACRLDTGAWPVEAAAHSNKRSIVAYRGWRCPTSYVLYKIEEQLTHT
jgi:hypothetical protein